MANKKKTFKRIRNQRDINNLIVGSRVRVNGITSFGIMRYNGMNTEQQYNFLGRGRQADELRLLTVFNREQLYPDRHPNRKGNLHVRKPYVITNYKERDPLYKNVIQISYKEKLSLLEEAGI